MTDRATTLTAMALGTLLALGLGACSKEEEPKSDEDIWAEATGEEPMAEDDEAAEEDETAEDDDADEATAAEDAAGEATGAEGDAEDGDEEASDDEAEGDEAAEEDDADESASAPAPTEIRADGSRLYGSPLTADAPVVALADVLAHADRYDGRVVRTQGEVARVCQAMGCWMELRAASDGDAIRVPMAGHAFFLPKDAAGRQAEVAGRVKVAALDPAQQAHLRAEGAQAAAQPVSLTATGVVLR